MTSKDPRADYNLALDLKNGGNTAFKSGDLKLALKNYTRIFMHIGMNPCMNMSQIMGGGGGGAGAGPKSPQKKDPLQQETDLLRLTAFNNIAAVYAKLGNWDECKTKCTRVLTHDANNTKALFRRAKAYRMLGLYELAHADLKVLQKNAAAASSSSTNNSNNSSNKNSSSNNAINNELKLLLRAEKSADKEFYATMKKRMQKAKRKKLNKKKKAQLRANVVEENEAQAQELTSKKVGKANSTENVDGSVIVDTADVNENLAQNTTDTDYVWDLPAHALEEITQQSKKPNKNSNSEEEVNNGNANANSSNTTTTTTTNTNAAKKNVVVSDDQNSNNANANANSSTTVEEIITTNANQPTMF